MCCYFQEPNIEPPDTVLTALRKATAQRHALLDSGLVIGQADATALDYRSHLMMLRAWLAPMERWLVGFNDGPQDEVVLSAKTRLDVIDADLGNAAEVGTDAGTWPQDASAAYRWGVCYVVEGSQLGGAVLYKRLKEQMAPHPMAYLQGEPGGPGPRWRLFMEAIHKHVTTPAQVIDAQRGACDAFDKLICLSAFRLSAHRQTEP